MSASTHMSAATIAAAYRPSLSADNTSSGMRPSGAQGRRSNARPPSLDSCPHLAHIDQPCTTGLSTTCSRHTRTTPLRQRASGGLPALRQQPSRRARVAPNAWSTSRLRTPATRKRSARQLWHPRRTPRPASGTAGCQRRRHPEARDYNAGPAGNLSSASAAKFGLSLGDTLNTDPNPSHRPADKDATLGKRGGGTDPKMSNAR